MSETDGTDADRGHYHLRLYVAGQTTKSLAAMANLKRVCEEHLAGRYEIEVIDLVQQPKLAAGDIGDLATPEQVWVGLDIRPKGPCA